MPLFRVGQKAIQQVGARDAGLESLTFVFVLTQRISQLEVQCGCAHFVGRQGLRIRRLQGKGEISRRLVAGVEERALRVGQRGDVGPCRYGQSRQEDGRYE